MNQNCNPTKSKISSFKKTLGAFFNRLFIFSVTAARTKTKTSHATTATFQSNRLGLIGLLIIGMLCTNFGFAQNPGQAANFSIKADTYSGAFNSVSDDWFQGPNGNGMIDESQAAAWQAIT
ncbi:MAG: hypothetical protein HKN40_07360, partial [Winogradskyella sp.]|uniref:hypothetical protein n=1 Tax=Winogradskyella sp. TaxID=1883156 RepID=UPI0017DDE245|nr:hypothetical protein [Winogradskyella sp.]